MQKIFEVIFISEILLLSWLTSLVLGVVIGGLGKAEGKV